MTETSISENYKNYNPHPLRHFEIFERHTWRQRAHLRDAEWKGVAISRVMDYKILY